MLTEYVEEALRRARYDKIDDLENQAKNIELEQLIHQDRQSPQENSHHDGDVKRPGAMLAGDKPKRLGNDHPGRRRRGGNHEPGKEPSNPADQYHQHTGDR